jgi:glycosyltransferase involved in cell wall biosynthesis
MLGWEYPPRFAGGLGKACQGLSQALARLGTQVFFVLPTFPERVSENHLEVVGARECLLEAGWNPDQVTSYSAGVVAPESEPHLIRLQSAAQLFPYGAHPEGQVPKNLRDVIDRMSVGEPDLGILGSAQTSAPLKIPQIKPFAEKIDREKQVQAAVTNPPGEIYGKNLWTEIERFCLTVRHLAEAHEVDLVHAHDWMTFPAAFEFQRVTGVPVFLHVHATEYDRSGENLNHEVFRIEREGFRKATHIFAVSRYTAGMIERLYGIPRKKISVVYNAPEEGSKLPLFAVEAERKPQVVFLGRLTFQKGPDHFLKAAALVCEANREAQFVFCGTGDLLDQLRLQAHRLGIENRVHFAGFMNPTEVDQVLLHSRVLVMPSVSEPFGLVALEAIRCGIPVILSKQSGVREVLNRALQVDFWDHEKLADQILAALRLKGLSQQLVDEGMDQLGQLSWESSAKQVVLDYRHLLGSTYAQSIGGAHGR